MKHKYLGRITIGAAIILAILAVYTWFGLFIEKAEAQELTKTLTPLMPVKGERNIYTVGFHLEVKDDNVTVIDVDVTSTYAENQPLQPIIDTLRAKAQALIDNYKAESILGNKAAYINAINQIDSELVL